MILIKLKGGLGNQLFQYTFGRLLSVRRNEVLYLDKDKLGIAVDTYREYRLSFFNIVANIASEEDIKKIKYPLGIFSKIFRGFQKKILRVFHIGWSAKMVHTRKQYVEGYWQTYKYAEEIRVMLLNELVLREPIESAQGDLLAQILSTTAVSIHVRRGDYVTVKKTSKFHNVCDISYYNRAIATILESVSTPTIFVFSDDIEWVKRELHIDLPVIYVSRTGVQDYEELILMSKCQHNIIANSSFSWWGAWLNQNPDKIVIAPKQWVLGKRNDTAFKDIVPPDWTRL
jgi:hypothetical protein